MNSLQSQLRAVSSAARELQRAVVSENALPSGFPRAEIEFWAGKLAELPKGTAEGAREPLLYASERLVEIGREYIALEGDAEEPGGQSATWQSPEIPPLSRGGMIDLRLSSLLAAISYAKAEYNRLAGQNELAIDQAPGSRLTSVSPGDRAAVLETADRALAQVREIQGAAPSPRDPPELAREFETLNRLSVDAATHIGLTQHALREPSPRRLVLARLGASIKRIARAGETVWKGIRLSINVVELGVQAYGRFQEEALLLAFKYLNEFADGLENLMRKATRLPAQAQGSASSLVGRDGAEAWYPELVAIPGGTFSIGSPDDEAGRNDNEGPVRRIAIAGFLMGRYPVTWVQYDHFCADTSRLRADDRGWGRGMRPAINVSQADALDYCAWLSGKTGLLYRLPAEAEWEYCCRAGTTTPFSFGETISADLANFDEIVGSTTEVGQYPPNPWALYDMHGNVWERCLDVWHDSYMEIDSEGRPRSDGADHGLRVMRGGSWSRRARHLRSACRYYFRHHGVDDGVGFRCVREIA